MGEIVWIEAQDYCVMVHSTRGRHLVRGSLTALEEQLDPEMLVRAHRTPVRLTGSALHNEPVAQAARGCIAVTTTAISCSERQPVCRESHGRTFPAKLFDADAAAAMMIGTNGGFMNARTIGRLVGMAAVVGWVAVVATRGAMIEQGSAPVRSAGVMPQYDKDRNLLLPAGYRQWVLAGSSLGLSYAEGGAQGAGMQMFNTTPIEPTAYKHFVETGQFRAGTMLVLLLQGQGTNALPARRGQFATDVHGVEMAVKDSSRVPEGWAYYNFGGSMMGGLRTSAAPQPKTSCYSCHVEHAARDNVFMQFYQMLSDAAPQARK